MEELDRKEHFTKPHLAHMRHLPDLEQLQGQINEALHSIDLDADGEFVFATKVCCYTTAEIVADLNRAILQSLKIASYSAAEALSRTSLENSINLILFALDATSNTPKSILLNFFKRAKDGAAKWHRHSVESGDAESAERSRDFEQSMDNLRTLFGDLDSSGVKGWPDAFSRFRDAGYGHFYHVLFAPASDSAHGFSNDIFNRFLTEMLPGSEKEKTERMEEQLAEKISFAFYLATHSILFYCVAASHIADRAGAGEVAGKLHIIGDALSAMLVEHEALTTSCLERLVPMEKEITAMRIAATHR